MKSKLLKVLLILPLLATLAACGITTATTTTDSAVVTTLRQFTLADLAQYNGDGGSTAYIAVNGTVYDVTGVSDWSNGWHKGMHLAGTDASAAFADSPHSLSFLSQLDIVGTLTN